ncbi:MAG: hypothetical protein ACP5RS_07420, partial [Thermoplasmata archaeon]
MIPYNKLTYQNSEDLEFIVDKFDYNQYSIEDHDEDIKGILRIATVPFRIIKQKNPPTSKQPYAMQAVNVISFVNKGGKYGVPNSDPITLQ